MAEDIFDTLCRAVVNDEYADKTDELIKKMEEVLSIEKLGTMDDMMNNLMTFLASKDKLNAYTNDEEVSQIPLETVFSWFISTVKRKRKGEF